MGHWWIVSCLVTFGCAAARRLAGSEVTNSRTYGSTDSGPIPEFSIPGGQLGERPWICISTGAK